MKESLMDKIGKLNNKWVRLAVFTLVAVNSGSMMMGYEIIPFSNDKLVSGVSIAMMVGSELWNHWKNNSYTEEAERADRYMKAEKNKKKRKEVK